MAQPSFFELVRGELQETEARMRAVRQTAEPSLVAATDQLLGAGGKRVRPTVALLAGRMISAPDEPLLNFAAAVEMLHTATLVHDDLIDGALLRRGIPTLNSQWTPGATVLAGDFIFASAAHFGAQTKSLSVMRLFARTLMTITNGELAQMFGRSQKANREDYDQRIYAKTGALFELAGSGAALLNDKSLPWAEPLGRYGREVGMAFQIVDDILDFTADSTHIGKPVGSDLRQGLITLPVLCYFEAHPRDPNRDAVLDPQRRHQVDIDRVVDLIRGSEAIPASLAVAQRCVSQARASLDGLPQNAFRSALVELADYVVSRDL